MKRYRITYRNVDRSRPYYLIQISKSGRADGVRIAFWNYGKKAWQDNWENDWLNGIQKQWWSNSKNFLFRNSKKDKRQGIQIEFKKNENISS